MKPMCPKHNVPMTVLFSSAVCDLCDPPKKASRKTVMIDLTDISAAAAWAKAASPNGPKTLAAQPSKPMSNVPNPWRGQGAAGYGTRLSIHGDWEAREEDQGHSNLPTVVAILDWNGQPASFTFILEKFVSVPFGINAQGAIRFEVLDQQGGSFYYDDMDLSTWDSKLVGAQAICIMNAIVGHINSAPTNVLALELQEAIKHIFRWKNW